MRRWQFFIFYNKFNFIIIMPFLTTLLSTSSKGLPWGIFLEATLSSVHWTCSELKSGCSTTWQLLISINHWTDNNNTFHNSFTIFTVWPIWRHYRSIIIIIMMIIINENFLKNSSMTREHGPTKEDSMKSLFWIEKKKNAQPVIIILILVTLP